MMKTQVRTASRVMSTTFTPHVYIFLVSPRVFVTCALQYGVLSHSSLLFTLDTQTHKLTSEVQPCLSWVGRSEREALRQRKRME